MTQHRQRVTQCLGLIPLHQRAEFLRLTRQAPGNGFAIILHNIPFKRLYP